MPNWTTADLEALYRSRGEANPLAAACDAPAKPNKYNARKKEVDGILFDSTREALRYRELKVAQSCGMIFDLELQPVYVLQFGMKTGEGKRIAKITYRADFRYRREGKTVVEDVKGMETEVWRIKWKLARVRFPDICWEVVK